MKKKSRVKSQVVLRISEYRDKDPNAKTSKGKILSRSHKKGSKEYTTRADFKSHEKITRIVYLKVDKNGEADVEGAIQKHFKKFRKSKNDKFTAQVQLAKGKVIDHYNARFSRRKELFLSRSARMQSVNKKSSEGKVHNRVIDMLDDFDKTSGSGNFSKKRVRKGLRRSRTTVKRFLLREA